MFHSAHKAIPIEQGLKQDVKHAARRQARAHKAIPIEQGLKLCPNF